MFLRVLASGQHMFDDLARYIIGRKYSGKFGMTLSDFASLQKKFCKIMMMTPPSP